MASIISAGTTSGTSLNLSGDTSGVLQLASNGSTTAVTISTGQQVQVNTAGTASAPVISKSDDTNTGIFFPTADTIAFSEGGVESMRIDSAGDVGIGNTSPYAKLQTYQSSSTLPVQYAYRGTQGSDVSLPTTYGFPYLQIGRTEFNANSLQTIGFGYINTDGNNPPAEIGYLTTSTSGETLGDLVFATRSVTTNTAASERMRITSGGVLCIGQNTDSPGSSNVITNGPVTICYPGNATLYRQLYYSSNNNFYFYNGSNQAYITSAGAFTNASDARLKEEIVDIKYGISDVMKMQPRNYQMKSDATKCVGFIAQELQTVIPECVSGDDEHYFGVDYGTLTAVLTKAIQELKAELDATKAEVQALKGVA
jgi:hypothetical protein